MEKEIISFADALSTIENMSSTAWLYLPDQEDWTLESGCAVLESEEVPPELEDEPDAGTPEFAKLNNLARTLPITVVQDIVRNAQKQDQNATMGILLEAFKFYYKHDAFIRL